MLLMILTHVRGSIYYDAISGILIKIAKSYTDIDLIFSLSQPDTAAGEYLDSKASEYGITRHKAEKGKIYCRNYGNRYRRK